MVDKPLEKMRKDELIKLVREQVEELTNAKHQVDKLTKFLEERWPEIETVDRKIGTVQSRVDQLDTVASKIDGDVKGKHDSITKLHVELLGGKNKDGEEVVGKNQALDEFFEEKKGAIEKTENEVDELKKELTKWQRVAITVGLATKYQSAKEENKKAGTRYNILFFVFLAALAGVNIWLIKDPSAIGAEGFWELLSSKVALSFPLVWFAWHCQKAATESRRIGEEYHHKQRVMELYVALIGKESDFPAEDQQVGLVKVVLDTMQENPAQQVKGPTMPGLLGKFGKSNGD